MGVKSVISPVKGNFIRPRLILEIFPNHWQVTLQVWNTVCMGNPFKLPLAWERKSDMPRQDPSTHNPSRDSSLPSLRDLWPENGPLKNCTAHSKEKRKTPKLASSGMCMAAGKAEIMHKPQYK